jgi:hypothetical protein
VGSIVQVLPAALLFATEDLISGAGGFAAAIAIGAFLGQVIAVVGAFGNVRRREAIAVGGIIGLVTMTGLILLSGKSG